MRKDGRGADELRPMTIERGVFKHAEGSALIKMGDTHVLCSATVEEKAPPFMKDKGKGWVTAEYSMLPRATHTRTPRERKGLNGRVMEIQRLIGRSLRCIIEPALLGERTITVDCDVIQADGGTRCASITGAYIALSDAVAWLMAKERIARSPIKDQVAAISVGIVQGSVTLDLAYEEDSSAEVDMNIVMTGGGLLVEVQGTAETHPFGFEDMTAMMNVSRAGLSKIFEKQREVTGV
ncbi:MAG: ribonuclease PH [Nitrospinae bacterium]|nr:ribonuclease PH [Nitrospinota bacterium]